MADTVVDERFDEKPLRELFRELSEDSSKLLRQESELFRHEMTDHVDKAKREVAALGVGGLLAYVGFLALTACVILALDVVLPAWAAALIVGGVYAIVGGILLLAGREKLVHEELGPNKSIDSVKKDVRAMREAFR
jgi:hypothetical protein